MHFSLPNRIKKQGMVSAIFFIVALISINFGLFFYNRASLYQSQATKEQVEAVNKSLTALWFLLQQGDVGIRGYLVLQEEKMMGPYYLCINNYITAFERLEDLLQKQNFNDPSLATYKKNYTATIQETIRMKKLVDEGKPEEAKAILRKDFGLILWDAYQPFYQKVTEFENSLGEKAEKNYTDSLYNTMILQVILFLVSFPVLSMVIYRLRHNDNQRRELFDHLNQNNKKYIFCDYDQSEQELDDKKIITELITNLQRASDFIKNITQGNYDVQWDGIDANNQHLNTDNLAGDLMQMREQMKKVKEEDNKRLWTNEGLNKFSDLLRFQDNLFEEKIHVFLFELTKYVQANQGAIFVVIEQENQEKVLEMKSCYAYDRYKHLTKTIYPGEGLIGQAYLEKDIIFLTDIPSNYVAITSGLGQAAPNSILIVPLIYNEQVVGILELASFRIFEEFQIQFIRKLLESLASTLISAHVSERTKLLLIESQQRAEELRAQEEEMRQNMEELSATQEEMHRKEKEYMAIIDSLKSRKMK
jgi:CHASE3 domain sensor protein